MIPPVDDWMRTPAGSSGAAIAIAQMSVTKGPANLPEASLVDSRLVDARFMRALALDEAPDFDAPYEGEAMVSGHSGLTYRML